MAYQTIANESAFPEINHENPQFSNPTYGLTKREYFAAMAMHGVLARTMQSPYTDVEYAEYAVDMADALIEQLNK